MSAHAKVHMVGAVLAHGLPAAGHPVASLRYATRLRRLAAGLGIAAGVVGVLVLLSAAGIDTAGLGAPKSWALWQGTMLIIEMALVTSTRWWFRTSIRVRFVPDRAAPVKSALQ